MRDLSALAYAAMNSMPSLAEALTEELERARILAKGRQPEHIVCMNSEVEFRKEPWGPIHKVTLVYPGDADISEGKISVLTPVGTALIGLRTGQSITWELPAAKFGNSRYSKSATLPRLEGEWLSTRCHAANTAAAWTSCGCGSYVAERTEAGLRQPPHPALASPMDFQMLKGRAGSS